MPIYLDKLNRNKPLKLVKTGKDGIHYLAQLQDANKAIDYIEKGYQITHDLNKCFIEFSIYIETDTEPTGDGFCIKQEDGTYIVEESKCIDLTERMSKDLTPAKVPFRVFAIESLKYLFKLNNSLPYSAFLEEVVWDWYDIQQDNILEDE